MNTPSTPPADLFAAMPGSLNPEQEPRADSTKDPARSGVGGVFRLPRQAISIRQPWAWLIVNGWKNIENRMWRTSYRGPVLIHASKGMTREEYASCKLFMAGFTSVELPPMETLERGGIVGMATILDCVDDHPSEWFCGEWGFVLADQRPFPFFAFKGALSFFRVDCPELVRWAAGAGRGADSACEHSGAGSESAEVSDSAPLSGAFDPKPLKDKP